MLRLISTIMMCACCLTAANPVTIGALRDQIWSLETVKGDTDTDKDLVAAAKTALTDDLKQFTDLLQAAIKQVQDLPKDDRDKVVASLTADLKWAVREQLAFAFEDKNTDDAKKYFDQQDSIDGAPTKPPTDIMGARSKVKTLQEIDHSSGLPSAVPDQVEGWLTTAQQTYAKLACQEVVGLNLLKNVSSATSNVKTKADARVKALPQEVKGGKCPVK